MRHNERHPDSLSLNRILPSCKSLWQNTTGDLNVVKCFLDSYNYLRHMFNLNMTSKLYINYRTRSYFNQRVSSQSIFMDNSWSNSKLSCDEQLPSVTGCCNHLSMVSHNHEESLLIGMLSWCRSAIFSAIIRLNFGSLNSSDFNDRACKFLLTNIWITLLIVLF